MTEHYLRRLAEAMERVANALERAHPKAEAGIRPEPDFRRYWNDPDQLTLPWHSTSTVAAQRHYAQSVAQHDQEPFLAR